MCKNHRVITQRNPSLCHILKTTKGQLAFCVVFDEGRNMECSQASFAAQNETEDYVRKN